ncbi:hypothetical protein F2Q69_00049815 [Brassica cretica]|uniref:DUF1985 domain-containing protein n=1 Tax=Brassica cretica TaxID=69181 RepID=A0A8S9PYD4_BRACR|nr:hypothetical protein F2Q69_00049815 [Brassica cretica]
MLVNWLDKKRFTLRLLCQRSTDKYRDLAPATTSRARASRNKASVPSHTGGPATAAKTRSQTKDPELSYVFGSLFDTLDLNFGTQEHLQKTMGNLTQESHVKGFDPSQEIFNRPFLNDIDDPEVRFKDSDYELTHGAAPAYTHTPAATTKSTQAPRSDSTLAPTPTPASTHASAPATTSRARASRNKASVPSHTGGPATAAKTRSQTKMFVILILFDTIDFNLGTQEHLQKTMSKLTQESYVKGFDPSQEIFNRPFLNDIDDPEVRCKDSDYELVFVPEDKFSKLTEWILKPKVLQIGPSKFDAELVSRIMGPNEWLKNNDMDAMMYLFWEKTSLRRWKPNRVAFMNCMFSNQIITAYGKFDGNMRGYKVDNNLLEYGRGELPYHGSTGFFICESSNEIAMTSSSTSYARFPRISTHGVPTRCWCGEGITMFGSSTAENRVEHQMSEKLKEKVDLEIARVAHEMKHKLKIAIVAMVVVGAIVGIWTSLSV